MLHEEDVPRIRRICSGDYDGESGFRAAERRLPLLALGATDPHLPPSPLIPEAAPSREALVRFKKYL